MKVRAVIFDAVGTLFRSRGTIGEIYAGVAKDYGSRADPAEIERHFVRLTASEGAPIEKAGWKFLVGSIFAEFGPFPRFDEFFEEVFEVFRTDQGWRCYPETERVLETLAQHGYSLGVVSNFDSRLHGVLEDLKISDYFDAIVTPDSAGYAKPNKKIFLEATRCLGVEPGEALFAGDDFGQDFEAATRAGLLSVLIDRSGRKRPEEPMAIPDLSGILSFLGIRVDSEGKFETDTS